MAKKILVVVVDNTMSMAPHWDIIRTLVLNNIVRDFCSRATSTSAGPSSCGQCLLYLVMCGSPNRLKSSAAEVTGSKSMESFLSILSDLAFFDQGAPALEEGLACALKCFAITQERQGEQLLVDRQCILITASEESVGPKLVEVPTHQRLHSRHIHITEDAEFLAAMLAKSFVPLSVICRSGLHRMRDIYNAGNTFNQTYRDFAIEFEHPKHDILMSDKFPGVRQALGHLKQKITDEPLLSFTPEFTDEQLHMILEMLDSEDSAEQPRDETANVINGNRWYLPLQERSTSHFELGESSRALNTPEIEEMDTLPAVEVATNFASSSTSILSGTQMEATDTLPTNQEDLPNDIHRVSRKRKRKDMA
ncbi:mediator of RNA polymerase II transcription subunit 25 [Artemisia annua]|uniref:Mediator of RNA polymerase II transcription subunit 25 n=1 Tax=Artemisia annua TaxID=35608 RepID=A0A2U1KV66_ARTAN|nr:mediator of RNA polymerase II transcription subunit 25 [Artemisia annua]